MNDGTLIQFADVTVNPTEGCGGCELRNTKLGVRICYAGSYHDQWSAYRYGSGPSFEKVTLWPGRMAKAAALPDLTGIRRPVKPWLDGLPRTIFLGDMSDVLSDEIPFSYLHKEIVDIVTSGNGQRHRWLMLTKRPQRMAKFSAWLVERGISWPANLWAGTSVTSQGTVGRLRHLESVGNDTTTRFVSLEPQWGQVDLDLPDHPGIHWVIQGGQSGSNSVPIGLNTIRDVRDHCRAAGVAYFLKQIGAFPVEHLDMDGDGERGEFDLGATEPLVVYTSGPGKDELGIKDPHGGNWLEWPDDLRVRELPARGTENTPTY